MAKIVGVTGYLSEFGATPIPLSKSISVDESAHYSRYELAADSSASAVNFGPVTTASVIYIKTDNQITYTFNSDGESHTLNAGCWHLLMGDSITSLALTEPNSAACVLEIYIGGT